MRLPIGRRPVRFAALAALAGAATAAAPTARAQDINGGASWSGWTLVGRSDQLGVYGSGSATTVYNVYRTLFTFMNNAVTGSPTGDSRGFGAGTYSPGAFANGNTILGIGVQCVGPCTLTTPTLKFDLDNDSYAAASSVGGLDGRTSSGAWSEFRDFTVQFAPSLSWKGSTINQYTDNGTSNGGTGSYVTIPGGYGSGVSYDWPFRAFALPTASDPSYQMFFDLNAMQAIYGVGNVGPNGPFNRNPAFTGIGAFNATTGFALNGVGSNEVAFSAPTRLDVVPEPASLALVAAGLAGCALAATRRRRA